MKLDIIGKLATSEWRSPDEIRMFDMRDGQNILVMLRSGKNIVPEVATWVERCRDWLYWDGEKLFETEIVAWAEIYGG